ncbi:hypothetical protein GMOD_00002463 [Pyrenophora seminiperda CCB06]|uniref:Uncharacterized protein n=1 Tax=Pyrenophora seminiperda CCB06 TaxID=1302712 RepID=A0A3M7M2E6_9PLEO|nr:hypothetical protein GMOD_00002463 [Pyrenophora seminiperda CCB06]
MFSIDMSYSLRIYRTDELEDERKKDIRAEELPKGISLFHATGQEKLFWYCRYRLDMEYGKRRAIPFPPPFLINLSPTPPNPAAPPPPPHPSSQSAPPSSVPPTAPPHTPPPSTTWDQSSPPPNTH